MHPAALPPDRLLAECDVERTRRSGPGGQHRNKVETAIVLRHLPSGIDAHASEERSQEKNRIRAVFRLRVRLAIGVRHEPLPAPSDLWRSRCRKAKLAVNPAHDDYPTLLAEALDVIANSDFDVRAAAERLGTTSSQLVRFIGDEPAALGWLNAERKNRGMGGLKG